MKITAARIDVRVSTDDQAKEGYSLAAQEARCREFCAAQGWEMVRVYREDGYSAKSLKQRPVLDRLRADLRPGEVVVTWRLDRLSRRVVDVWTLISEWEQLGVAYRSVTEPFDTTSPSGRMFLTLLAAFAQMERELITERTMQGLRQKFRERQVNPHRMAPFGYDVGPDGRYVPSANARVVTEIFRRYASGASIFAITRDLGNRGAGPTGGQWITTTVRRILRNRAYLGELHYGGELTSGAHPPLVTPDLWELVQLRLRRRFPPRASGGTYVLTGMLHCWCGAPMSGSTSRSGGREYHYYDCNRGVHTAARHEPRPRAEKLEEEVYTAVMRRARDHHLVVGAGAGASLAARRRDLDQRIAHLVQAVEEQTLPAAVVRSRLATLESERAQLDQQEQEQIAPEIWLEAARTLGQVWATGSSEERRALLLATVREVRLNEAGQALVALRL